MDVIDVELCDYLQVKHSKLEPAQSDSTSSPIKAVPQQQQQQQQQKQPTLPSKFYKHWTSLWVVLHMEISPNYSYIGYCKKESDWLVDSQTIAKCYLDETFKVERPLPGYSKKYENVLQLTFKGYRLDLGFESMTKLDQWYKALQVTSERHHVDLVRCHEHPQLEGEYVVQVCPTSYLVWSPTLKPCNKPEWEWHLKHIRRVHWHKNVNKLEVEPGRSSDTGEGHFYFTGQHAFRLFEGMKYMMSTHSHTTQISSPLPMRAEMPSNGLVRTRDREGGSGSESDWTGTGDDWTGTSSDSTFINYLRSQHRLQHSEHAQFGSPRMTPSPPPPRTGSTQQGEALYTSLNTHTLNRDNTYCSVDRLQPIAGKSSTLSPSPNRGTASTNTTPLDSVAELGESLTEEEEYCKMVPNAGIRAALALQMHTSPLHTHRPHPVPTRNSPGSPLLTHRHTHNSPNLQWPSLPTSPLPRQRQPAPMHTSPSDPSFARLHMASPLHRQPLPPPPRSLSVSGDLRM